MQLDQLSEAQRGLWSRVDQLWKLALERDATPIRAALHPGYSGWVTGQARPHDREAAVAAVGPASPRVLSYRLRPLAINIFDRRVGVVHYNYDAELEPASPGPHAVSGRWTEVYLLQDGEWLMIAVSGGPDGER
jgi:hypothetical protein